MSTTGKTMNSDPYVSTCMIRARDYNYEYELEEAGFKNLRDFRF
jgi:hypothetical protein